MNKENKELIDITVKFTVDVKDLAEANNNARPSKHSVFNLRDIIQRAMYDNDDGPMLSGQFKLIPEKLERQYP